MLDKQSLLAWLKGENSKQKSIATCNFIISLVRKIESETFDLEQEHEKDLIALEQEIEGWKAANRLLKVRNEFLEERLEKCEVALHDFQVGLAAALQKNGGSMDFNYHEFFEMRRNEVFEFVKNENFHNDSVTISLKK